MFFRGYIGRKHCIRFIVLISGALLPLAFAPMREYGLAFFSPIVLMFFLWRVNAREAFVLGGLYGIGYFGVGVSWIFISIHKYGNTPIFLGGLFTAVFVAFLACFPAVQAFILNRFFKHNRLNYYALAFPLTWILVEWVRSWILTGFPWLLIAYSQVDSPLHGYVPILGAYGTGFILLFSAGLMLIIFEYIYPIFIKPKKITSRQQFHFAVTLAMLFMVWLGGQYFADISWTQPYGKPVTVSLVQGDIPQSIKWQPTQSNATIEKYTKLTKPYWKSDIIVWPEAAIPIPLPQAEDYIAQLSRKAQENRATLITGIPIQVANGFSYYNAMIAIGKGSGHYYKRHLVPFGEYVPFDNYLRGLIGFFNLPMSDLTSGPKRQKGLRIDQIVIAPFICYEIAYADRLETELPRGKLLVTISDDTWFGNSFAPAQHLQIGQFRALQSGRPLLFSSNDGITAIVNDKGKVIKQAPQFIMTVLTGDIQPMQGETPWLFVGNVTIIGAILFLLGVALLVERR